MNENTIENLSIQLTEVKDKLRTAYSEHFKNDPDLLDAVRILNESPVYRMTHKGLVASVSMDFQDFDDEAMDALTDHLMADGMTPDFRLGFISHPITNYVLYEQGDDTDSIFIKTENDEDNTVIEGITTDDDEDRKALLLELISNRSADMTAFFYGLDNAVEQINLEIG